MRLWGICCRWYGINDKMKGLVTSMEFDSTLEKVSLAMHIAVCDDNVGDRKQLERLLGRESDARALKTGVFYVDSYGNAKAVMQSPMLYDAFFIDMVSGDMDGISLANRLLEIGVTAPIILCISTIDYRKNFSVDSDRDSHNIFYLDKPLKKAELSEILDLCISKKSQSSTSIELRGEKETRYVLEDDIIYAKKDGNYIMVSLKDGSTVNILSSLESFYAQLESCSHYVSVNGKSMLNILYVEKLSFLKAVLTNGSVIQVGPSYYQNMKQALRQYAEKPEI